MNLHNMRIQTLSEARAHGVGYFKFSRDEKERRKEQERLRKVREETEARQKEARLLRERREVQRQSRLIAARQRQRQRMGLPPLSQEEILAEINAKTSGGSKREGGEDEEVEGGGGEAKTEKPEQLTAALDRTAHVRPWDIGKTSQPELSQEEWVEKQRAERRAEFAPNYHSSTGIRKRRDLDDLPATSGSTALKRGRAAEDHQPPAARTLEEEIEARLAHIRDNLLPPWPKK